MAPEQDDKALTFENADWGLSDEANVVEPDPSADSPPAEASAEGQPPASATNSPATPPADGVVEARENDGPIPVVRHKAILDNERRKRETVEAEYAPYKALGVSPDEARESVALYRGIQQANGVEFLDKYYQNLANDPQAAGAVRSWAARVLAGHAGNGNGQPPVNGNAGNAGDIRPDYRHPEDGTEFASFDVVRKLVDQMVGQRVNEVHERYAPIVNDWESRQRADQEREVYDRATKEARDEYEALKDAPYFNDLRNEIKAHLDATKYKSFQSSYLHALKANWGRLSKTGQAKVIADMQTQAFASVGKPNAASVTAAPANATKLTDHRLQW